MSDIRVVPITAVVTNAVKLREVDRSSVSYQELKEDIRQRGITDAPTAREVDIDGVIAFQLANGLHRYTAALDLGHTEITINVVELDDDEMIYHQIAMNSHTVDTKPVAFTKMLRHLILRNPFLTMAELAQKIGKSTEFVTRRLDLQKITDETIQELVDGGQIKLLNAYSLSKLTPEQQLQYVTEAQTESTSDFSIRTQAIVKENADAVRQARQPQQQGFVPVAGLRKFALLKEAPEDEAVIARILSQSGDDPRACVVNALLYVIKLDSLSIDEQKYTWEEKQKSTEEAKLKAKQKREAAAAAKALEAQERAQGAL